MTNPPELVDASRQTDKPTDSLTTKCSNRNYTEELAVQMKIADKAKERYETAKAEVDHLKEQATKREVELQHLLDD